MRARPSRPLREDLALAERCAREAGGLLLERFGGPIGGVDSKTTRTDLVSDADRDAEEAIVRLLAAERPDDGLLAEEGAEKEGTSGRRWVVDPLDGTVNYLYGHPQWCVSVALEDAESTLLGVVHDPVRDELFRAARGEGAELDGRPLRIDAPERLATAMVATGFAYDAGVRARQADVLRELLPRVRDIRRAGAAALDLAWLAAGRVDAYYERDGKPWDWAAGLLLLAEAGGESSPLPGEPPGLLAAPPALLDELYELVSPI